MFAMFSGSKNLKCEGVTADERPRRAWILQQQSGVFSGRIIFGTPRWYTDHTLISPDERADHGEQVFRSKQYDHFLFAASAKESKASIMDGRPQDARPPLSMYSCWENL